MEQKILISKLAQHFDLRELVSRAVWEKYGHGAWRFFDVRLLETLLALRTEVLGVPLVCNNWAKGGNLQQRGLRENTCDMVKAKTSANTLYLSAHTLGKALDLSSGQMTAEEMRKAIARNAEKLPHLVRVEHGDSAPTWLHIDVMTDVEQNEKVRMFR
jgi:hypothetical protein